MIDSVFLSTTVFNFVVDVLYVLVGLLIGLIAYDYFNKKLFPDLDFPQEIRKGNLAVAIFASAILFFIAYLIAEILR